MANYYCEPKPYPAYTATPPNTSTAYDGDGLAKGLATPAYVTIDLTAYTADAGDTVVVGGATLTCVASGAGANQFNAGSGSTLATNLASAINAATNTVNAAATDWSTPQLRNACYGSASGANLTIQTRAGSAVYNSNTSWKVVSTGLTGGSQLDATFANGASGAWGYLFNDYDDSTIWPQAIAVGAYGVGRVSSGSVVASLAGPTAATGISVSNDIIHVRCNGKTLTLSAVAASGNVSVTCDRPAFFLFDDGTEWSGDSGYYTLLGRNSIAYANNLYLGSQNGPIIWQNRSRTWTNGLKITSETARGRWGLGPLNVVAGHAQVIFDGLLFVNPASSGSTSISFGWINSMYDVLVKHCKWVVNSNYWFSIVQPFSANYSQQRYVIEDCVLDFSQYTGANSYCVNLIGGNQLTYACVIRNNKLIASSSGHTAFGNSNGTIGTLLVENNENMALNTSLGLVASLPATTAAGGSPESSGWVLQQGMAGPTQMRFENRAFILEYEPDGAYPYYDSYLPDGTGYSLCWHWSNQANAHRETGVEIWRRSQQVEAANQQTVTLELLFDNTLTPKTGAMEIVVSYTKASDSKVYHEYMLQGERDVILGTSTIPTSAASWTKAGAYASWTARKLVLTLSSTIKQYTQIDVALVQHRANESGASTRVFINPELGLST